MNVLNIETIKFNDDFAIILSEVLHEAVSIVGRENFVLALCAHEEELKLAS